MHPRNAAVQTTQDVVDRHNAAALPRLLDILRPIQADIDATSRVIRQRVASDVAMVGTVAEHIIGGGGKRLRPTVLLLAARANGYSGTAHHALAAVIEFIHTATLLHDDVVDESSLRRGRATANALFGNSASVLVGDFLYSRAFQMMVEHGSPQILAILADATNRIAEGEVLQLMQIHDPSVNEARYRSVIDRKTATLFEAATRVGAVVAEADAAQQERCAAYGTHLGRAFQMIDDVLDYAGNTEYIGKQLGDDLREGKCTLPLIHALEAADAQERSDIERAIREGEGDFVRIAAIVERSGAIAHVRARAHEEIRLAQRAVAALPQSEFKDCLLDLAFFALHRDR
jgi:octaprenyl-diphosphate synthase